MYHQINKMLYIKLQIDINIMMITLFPKNILKNHIKIYLKVMMDKNILIIIIRLFIYNIDVSNVKSNNSDLKCK